MSNSIALESGTGCAELCPAGGNLRGKLEVTSARIQTLGKTVQGVHGEIWYWPDNFSACPSQFFWVHRHGSA